jgi:two-component system response regulator MprA
MLERRLEMEGYEVVTATDGFEALERLRNADSGEPDVILLDAMMPNMSGTEVLAELRESGSKIPVLMISAHLDAQEPDRMRSLGASDCIPKPFEWDDLIGKIEELAEDSQRDGDASPEGPSSNAD